MWQEMATCKHEGELKRKQKALAIKEKLGVCRRLKCGATVTQLSNEVGVGKSTIIRGAFRGGGGEGGHRWSLAPSSLWMFAPLPFEISLTIIVVI